MPTENRSIFTMRGSKGNTSSSGVADHRNGGSIRLLFHSYRYFPYERELAEREVQRLAPRCTFTRSASGLTLTGRSDVQQLRKLTYFASIVAHDKTTRTKQHDIEASNAISGAPRSRQATRYSAHALHEYKGRFNPQLVAFLLNYLGVRPDAIVFDPFCGSGTTLVESAIRGIGAVGVDINPLAVFISNAKLRALATPADELTTSLGHLLAAFDDSLSYEQLILLEPDERQSYLALWFREQELAVLEALRRCILESPRRTRDIFLALVSDLLRDYSLQEPADLRIRRRISPMPETPLLIAFKRKAQRFIKTLAAAQQVIGVVRPNSKAVVGDSKSVAMVSKALDNTAADCVITSPPYATALPYIDTQRLSLVWLELCSVPAVRRLEGEAVGSREKRQAEPNWSHRIESNADELPNDVFSFCNELRRAVTRTDGFRRQATPSVVYRYFADMKHVFAMLSRSVKKQSPVSFVVGSNHTTLGGRRFEIDTSTFLAAIAQQAGFRVVDQINLQTYQRYDLHQKNSIREETLLLFRR